jgi:hypothetical protein
MVLLMQLGKMMKETGKELGSMGTEGLAIQRELVHSLLLLMSVISASGAPGEHEAAPPPYRVSIRCARP